MNGGSASNGENMEIRKCTKEDVAQVGAFYDRVVAWLDANGVNYPKWTYGEYPSVLSARANAAKGTQYVCMERDVPVGAFVLNDNPEGNYAKGAWSRNLAEGEYMVLHALAVAPDRFGNGIGSAMVRFAIDEAKARGYKGFRLDIVPGNKPARKLYEQYGFRYVGTYDLDRHIAHIPLFCLYELDW